MMNLEKLANDLVTYVQNGIITQENAEAVYEAACIREGVDPDATPDDCEMTLEEALDVLEAEGSDSSDSEDDAKAKAEAEKKKKEAKKKLAKVIAATTVASAAVAGTGYIMLTQTEKGRAKILASLHNKAMKVQDDLNKSDFSDAALDKYANDTLKLQQKIDKYSTPGFFKRLSMAAKAGANAARTTPSAKKLADKKNNALLNKAMKDFEDGKIDNIELDKILKQVEDNSKKHGIKTNKDNNYSYSNESASDEEPSVLQVINDYLEACAECDPTKNVENEIIEKLPVVNPNEDPRLADDPSIEKTDKAIEDAKKYLDVAGKLAEMKSAHEMEKDTTQQHEAIKQALESEEAVNITKLNIYEACDIGLISEDEKYELLGMIEESYED